MFFFNGFDCCVERVASAGKLLADVLNAGTLDGIRRLPTAVESDAVFDSVVDCDGEVVRVTLASSRLGPASTGYALISNALSQQPAAAATLPGVSLQQKLYVNEPLTSEHGIMLLKTFIAATTKSTPAQNLLEKQLGMID